MYNHLEIAHQFRTFATVYQYGKIIAEGQVRRINGKDTVYKVNKIEIDSNANFAFLDDENEEIEIYL